jgi:aspartate-semialdehyde dehydrogenase
LPHIGSFDEEGESREEWKMRVEARRILEAPDLPVSATCVRVPVFRGHSEAIWATFEGGVDPDRARDLLGGAGVSVEDEPARAVYPLPRSATGREGVFVGRIRRDPAHERGLALWVVADNLLKGAASNAFQIVQVLVERGLVPTGSR